MVMSRREYSCFIFKEKLGYRTQHRQACHISTFRTASVFS